MYVAINLMIMNKVKCEVCSGFGMGPATINLYEETCTSCSGKGYFDTPEDATDHSIESSTRSIPNWRKVSREIIKFQNIRMRRDFKDTDY